MRLIVLALTLGGAVAFAQSHPETVSGVLQVVVVEHLGKAAPAAETLQYSLLTGTGALSLIFEDPQDAENAPPGSVVEVTGYRTGKQLTVPADSAAKPRPNPHIRTMSAAPAPKTVGQRNVAVLLVTFQNDQRQLVDSATISAAVFGDVNAYYQEDSYGNLSIVGDIYGYLSLPINSSCGQIFDGGAASTGFTVIQNAAVSAAQTAGINLAGYDSVMVVGPELQSCTSGEGAGTIGGVPGYVVMKLVDPAEFGGESYEQLYDQATAHEIGHNLGLYHAKFIDDGNAVYSGSVPPNTCGTAPCYVEYGDYDVMGLSSPAKHHFHSAAKEFLGWLQPQTITATGNYQIGPYEVAGATIKALKIAPSQANGTFYVEYRQPIGFDSDLTLGGPTIHLGGNPAYLLNLNPVDLVPVADRPTDPGLFVGQTYVDYANRFSVTTVSTSPAAAQMLILVPGVDSPTLAFDSPTDGATVWGTVNISIDALDLSAISKVDISLDGSPLTSLTAAPYTFAWNAATASVGQHVISATAYNTKGNTAAQQITVTVSAQQIGGLLDGASFVPAVAPGSIVSLFVGGFSLPTAAAGTIPLPNNLGGASVTIAGQALPFFYVSSTQLNVQLPWNLPGGANNVTVSGGGVSATASFNVVSAAPGIFVYGNNLAVAQNQDYTLNDASHPAKAGSYVTVYLTGIGPLDNPVGLGQATPSQPYSRATTAAQATVGGMQAQISFIGMAPGFVGLAQADIQIPPTLAPGTYPIQIQMGDGPILSNAPCITTN